ncbi:flagellar biosynthetic protein FliO [Granulosicoccus antarcticus]|uniref:Flagellar protein n=1 Tax=Granulosicoccus antarcticus IMCC3135 TaxID=1192854 RepID=A0A2Z2NJ23_9GAMM|nr:flagellar biosynthetic protein FliO [Granulosicoccus antarcticus]ASJ70495.1 hypothetical protein IMCC3135_01905 [Granulosicoccus antarcticus IMCC3135]
MNTFPTTLLFTLAALVLVLVLAWFAIRLLSRLNGGKLGNNRIRLTHTLPLSTREKIVLVECDGKTYLLGVTANGISVIDQKPIAMTPTQPNTQ